MPKPKYPTRQGIWAKGKRREKKLEGVRLGHPYPEAVENLRRAAEGRDDFDPAALFVWGTMQATAVLNILKDAEKLFGREGQEMVRRAINRAGYEAAEQMLENSHFPEGLDDIELTSAILSGVNTVLYASLEDPWIATGDRCEFDILWCPHQDRYTAFDCRVQRYFVEGMIRAIEARGEARFLPAVQKLIPRGEDRCHFTVDRLDPQTEKHPWDAYSDELGEKAFRKLSEETLHQTESARPGSADSRGGMNPDNGNRSRGD